MYKILINIITKNKDKWIFYQEDGADYVASSLDDIKDKALELLDEYGEDNVKIVDQRSGDDSKKDIPTYLFGNGTGGTSDYNELENKPKINGVELINNKSLKDLGIIIPSNEDFTLEGLGEKSYNSLDDKPKIPKKVSELENDSKYETVESTDTKIAGAKSYADEAVANLVGSAPETLDTLEEVAKAIQDNETVVDALNAAIGSKADKTELGTKQDKLTAGDGIDIKDNIISADNNVEFFYNFTTVEAMQKVIDSMRAGKKAMLISKGNNAANKGSGMFEYPIFYSPDVSNIDWDTYSGALYFKSDWWMDSYTDVFHGNEIKLIPKWQYITVSILPGGIVKSVSTNGWSTHNNISNVMSSLNVLGKTNEVEYTPTKDYNPATKKYVDDALANIDVSFDDVYVVTCGHRFDGGYFEVTDDGSITEMMNKYWPKYLANRNQGGLVIWKDYTAYTNGTTLIGYMRGAEIYIQWPWTPQNNGLSSNPYGSVGVVTITGSWDSSTETYTLTKAVWNRTNYVPTQDYNPANKKYVDDNKYILPTATTDTLGGIKIGDGLGVDENGVVSASGGNSNENLDIYNIYTEISIDEGKYVPRPEGTDKELTDTYNVFEELINKLYVDGKKSFGVILHNKKWNLPLINYDITRPIMGVPTLQDKPTSIRLTTPYLTQYQINGINTATGTTLGMAKLDISLLWDNDICTVSSVKYNWAQINVNNQTQVLSKTNTQEYTPTANYHPATKKYVDDAVVAKQDVLTAGDNITIDENNVISSGKTNYLGYIEDYTSDNRLDITNLEKGTYSLGIKDRIGSQTLYLKVSHNGQEQTLDTQLQIEATVVSNMIYFDVRHPIKDISGYDEAIRISFSYLNSITSEIVNTGYGISYNNTSGILSNSARYNTKISAVTTDKEQTIMGKKTFNVLPESSVEPTNDNQFVNKKYVDGNKYELPIASADTLGGIKLGEGLSADENGVVSASGCDIPVYNFKMTSEYHKVTSTVTYVYMSSDDKIALQNIIQNAYDKGLETFALFVNQRVGTYTGTNEMHQDYLLTIVNGKLIKNKPSSLLLAGYSQGNSTLTDVYLSKLNISLPLSWNEDSCTVGTARYINVELRPLSSDNTIMYVPTSDYNPATKKYVDDQVGNINTVLATLTTVSEVTK